MLHRVVSGSNPRLMFAEAEIKPLADQSAFSKLDRTLVTVAGKTSIDIRSLQRGNFEVTAVRTAVAGQACC